MLQLKCRRGECYTTLLLSFPVSLSLPCMGLLRAVEWTSQSWVMTHCFMGCDTWFVSEQGSEQARAGLWDLDVPKGSTPFWGWVPLSGESRASLPAFGGEEFGEDGKEAAAVRSASHSLGSLCMPCAPEKTQKAAPGSEFWLLQARSCQHFPGSWAPEAGQTAAFAKGSAWHGMEQVLHEALCSFPFRPGAACLKKGKLLYPRVWKRNFVFKYCFKGLWCQDSVCCSLV